jgi:UDP-N-acetylmuramate dehydrogenase
LGEAAQAARRANLTGLEWATGIPGTVGGAVWGNAGAYGSEMKDCLESVEVLDLSDFEKSGKNEPRTEKYASAACQFGYRESLFKKKSDLIILACLLNLRSGQAEEITARMEEINRKRKEKIPAGFSAGSFFQNPVVENPAIRARFEKDAGCVCRDKKIPAGWIIDELGFRGRKIGRMMVSEQHANFIINLGGGSAEEAVILAGLIKQKARSQMGIRLREEIKYVGF